MTDKLVHRRKSAYTIQSGRCYYCGLPMWENDQKSFARIYGITTVQAQLLKSTAEHLEAKQDGGSNASDNIVAACRWCNSRRHRRKRAPDPLSYRNLVRKRLADGRWHSPSVIEIYRRFVFAG